MEFALGAALFVVIEGYRVFFEPYRYQYIPFLDEDS